MQHTEILETIKKATKGNKLAFEKLVDIKSETILFHSLSILGKYQDAEDAAQEVILKMYKNIKGLKDPEAFNAWLQRIISNECYNLGRTQKSRNEKLDLDEYEEELLEEEEDFIPHEYVETEESKGLVKESIDALPEKQRRVILMYYFDDMSYSEIAYAMDVSASTVSTNILHAKRAIKKKMEKYMDKDKKNVVNLSAMSVLTEILNEQAKDKITPSQLVSLKSKSLKLINRVSHPLRHQIIEVGKIATTVICVTGIATTGILVATDNLNEKNMKSINTDPPVSEKGSQIPSEKIEGMISFVDGECDCGHLNPKGAKADLNTSYKNISWKILDGKGAQVYDGQGMALDEYLRQLYTKGNDSEYTLEYEFDTDEYGVISIKRDFIIDTGEISEGQYR